MKIWSRIVSGAALSASAFFAAVAAAVASPSEAHSPSTRPVRVIEILVEQGYKPGRVLIHGGESVRLKLLRRDQSSCTREVVIPVLNIRRALPPHQPVFIELPALPEGEYELRCGKSAIRARLVVAGHFH